MKPFASFTGHKPPTETRNIGWFRKNERWMPSTFFFFFCAKFRIYFFFSNAKSTQYRCNFTSDISDIYPSAFSLVVLSNSLLLCSLNKFRCLGGSKTDEPFFCVHVDRHIWCYTDITPVRGDHGRHYSGCEKKNCNKKKNKLNRIMFVIVPNIINIYDSTYIRQP